MNTSTLNFEVVPVPDMVPTTKKKNCYSCKHLEYFESYYESSDDSGYSCNKRDYKNENDEYKHLTMLNTKPKYLERPKKCCEME